MLLCQYHKLEFKSIGQPFDLVKNLGGSLPAKGFVVSLFPLSVFDHKIQSITGKFIVFVSYYHIDN